jgi:general secretion pathway protein C
LATTVTLQRRLGLAGKLLAVLLVLALLWLVAGNVARMLLQRVSFGGAQSSPLQVQDAARTVVAANLFGAAASAPAGDVQPTSLNVRLKGVYAPLGSFPGFAIMSIDGAPDVGIVGGSELKPGVKLNAVNADHILIAHDGILERVNFNSAAPGSTAGSAAPGPAVTPQSLNVRPVSGNTPGSTYAVSRREFTTLLADPKQLAMLALLAAAPGGGIMINDGADGALVAKLGLKQGDIIQKINGQPVMGKDDLLKIAMNSPNTPEVSVEGTRNGQPLRLTYNVQP